MMKEKEIVEIIAADLLQAGLRSGGVLLVHSSLSAMGFVPGGPETVIQGFLKALGPDGTLLMPALSFRLSRLYDDNEEPPVFDVLNTPCSVGKIPDYFRTRLGTIRSLSPTHSVCGFGPLATQMLSGHGLDNTPCGEHSPYMALRRTGGQIVFLGCSLKSNTSMHAVEEAAGAPYLFDIPVPYRVILSDRSERRMEVWRHGFTLRHLNQRYDKLEPFLLEKGGLTGGYVMQANTHIVEAALMWEVALKIMAKDPFYFVERHAT
ncbi:MAG: AAC(3) family N-acetyltransferase [bacterium]|jgi:aminoglycoside 3-N-acetyltransferase|nr:AAC(3) family N-acetyltransferase [bacterium]